MLLRSSVVVPFFDTRALPALAERLLARGLDSPALMRLALMSTEPFDPRDAHEAADQASAELCGLRMSQDDAYNVLLNAVARAVLTTENEERAATDLAWQILMSIEFSLRAGKLAELGYLNDTWDAGWAGSNVEIAMKVRAILEDAREHGPLGEHVDIELLRSLMPFRKGPPQM